MIVTVTEWDDMLRNVPQSFNGTAVHAGVAWEWWARYSNGSGARCEGVVPIGDWTEDTDNDTWVLADGRVISLTDAGPVYDAVADHIEEVVALIGLAQERAALAVLEQWTISAAA